MEMDKCEEQHLEIREGKHSKENPELKLRVSTISLALSTAKQRRALRPRKLHRLAKRSRMPTKVTLGFLEWQQQPKEWPLIAME
ncbi:hypothetical protein CDL15_Pgr014394 [Punica granatum]|uniref:Uncharacterized protein n=1 Tax=Punica granatum TaxID=22663 RepID=A0A218WES9_PUNGR|nr:hypothetical protein CDL15_Pgr014394 [Punica granatum]